MAARVKNEQGLKPEPGIKPELDGVGASPAGTAMSEDDVYEDAGDLEFYEANDTGADSIFLTHIPKYLYDAWESMDDDAEIRIGTLRRWYNKGPNGERTHVICPFPFPILIYASFLIDQIPVKPSSLARPPTRPPSANTKGVHPRGQGYEPCEHLSIY